MTDIEQAINSLIAAVCGVDAASIGSERDLREYGMDSVRAVELLVRLEETFEISIPDEAVLQLRTVSDVARYVTRRRGASSAA